MASIFTKILNGELSGYKVYEDDHCFAILALDQVNLGHTLVIPKHESDSFMDTPEPYYSAVFKAAKTLSLSIRKATDAPRVGVVIAGFEVHHFHVHLIPAWGLGDIGFSKAHRRKPEEMTDIQKKIIQNLPK